MLWLRSWRAVLVLVLLIVVPIACSVFFLYDNAPRNWSLHWVRPSTVLAATSSAEYSAASVAGGWDVAWTRPGGVLTLTRMGVDGVRRLPDVALQGTPVSQPGSLSIATVRGSDVVVWREDTGNGSRLRAAIVSGVSAPLYRTIAGGVQTLEHVQALAAGSTVDVVWSWQRGAYNVYLSRVSPRGGHSAPRRLTNAAAYAFDPHGAVDSTGTMHLMYLDSCCNGQSFLIKHARFSPAGAPLGVAQTLEQVNSVGGKGADATPSTWGLDVRRDGLGVSAVWSGDAGINYASWMGSRTLVPSHTVVPAQSSSSLALSIAGTRRELAWQQQYQLGSQLATVGLNARGTPSQIDRVAYESASDDLPTGVTVRGQPAFLWQALPEKNSATVVEVSHFNPQNLGAPTFWSKLGLGLANPLGNFVLVLIGSVAVGALLTVANVLVVLVLIALYLLVGRHVPIRYRWYIYSLGIAVALFGLFVNLGAPSPPVLFINSLSQPSGLVAVIGMLLFIGALAIGPLRRIDDVFRAGIMAFGAVYFIAFLQALLLLQGQVAKI